MPESDRTIDNELNEFGVATVGDIDLDLVNQAKAELESPDIEKRHIRQTELRWNNVCDAIVKDFESVSEMPEQIYCPDRL